MLNFAKKIAVSAGRKAMKGFGKRFMVNYKSRFEPSIKSDLEVEKYLEKEISRKYPAHGIIGEEGASKEAASEYTWVIDPLDGTINFIHAFPYFAVSVALLKNGEPFIGVVYNPVSMELYWAEKGKGAFLNRRKIGVGSVTSLEYAYVSTGLSYKRGKGFDMALSKIKAMVQSALVVRRTGCASLDLCNVAKGSFDCFFIYNARPWDVLAGAVIITEAGGICTVERQEDGGMHVLAANPVLHSESKRLLAWGR